MQLTFHRAVKPYIMAEAGLCFLIILTGLFSGHDSILAAALIPFCLLCFTLYFFRNPARDIRREAPSIFSPADGRIRAVKQSAEWLPDMGETRFVSIYLSMWNVHINRIPVSGHVIRLSRNPGKHLPAYRAEVTEKNDHLMFQIENSSGCYAVQQVAGCFARRIVCDIGEGDTVRQGDIFGMIKFGSRVNLYLPPSTRIHVKEGDRVRAGVTIIGTVNHG